MGAPSHRELYLPGNSVLHRLAPQAKLLGALLFVLAVVATPREQVWAFAFHAAALVALAATARIAPGTFLRRLGLELPFVAFALLLPLVAPDGWWAAWNILAKATLGVAVSVVLTATTPVADLILAMRRLRLPAGLTAIVTFMVRYLDVITDDLARMQIARRSRCDDPRWLWQVRGIARTAGTVFVRCFERGERVHLAMLSRGFDGTMPVQAHPGAGLGAWLATLSVPAGAAAVALTAVLAGA